MQSSLKAEKIFSVSLPLNLGDHPSADKSQGNKSKQFRVGRSPLIDQSSRWLLIIVCQFIVLIVNSSYCLSIHSIASINWSAINLIFNWTAINQIFKLIVYILSFIYEILWSWVEQFIEVVGILLWFVSPFFIYNLRKYFSLYPLLFVRLFSFNAYLWLFDIKLCSYLLNLVHVL